MRLICIFEGNKWILVSISSREYSFHFYRSSSSVKYPKSKVKLKKSCKNNWLHIAFIDITIIKNCLLRMVWYETTIVFSLNIHVGFEFLRRNLQSILEEKGRILSKVLYVYCTSFDWNEFGKTIVNQTDFPRNFLEWSIKGPDKVFSLYECLHFYYIWFKVIINNLITGGGCWALDGYSVNYGNQLQETVWYSADVLW